MLPYFIVLAGLPIGLLYDREWATPQYDPRATVLGVVALVVLQAVFGRVLARTTATHRTGEEWHVHVTRLVRAANAYRVLGLAFYACAVWNLNWPIFVERTLHVAQVPGLGLLAMLLPLISLLLATFVGLHHTESIARGEKLPLRPYLAFHTRMGLLLPLIPALSVLTMFDLLNAIPAARTTLAVYPFINWFLLLGLVAAIAWTAPSILTRLWGAVPMPDGPLLQRFLAVCTHAGVPPPRFYLWPSRGAMQFNAAVVGLTSGTRVVLFTDGLIETFTADEMCAVLAHELGHVRYRHIHFYFALALGAAFFVTFAEYSLKSFVSEGTRASLILGFATIFGGASYGFFSRRFERQADLFAARCVQAQTFVVALEKVAALAGDVRKVWSFTHMSVERRVHYLLEAFARPEAASRFERNLRRLMTAGYLFVLVSLGAAIHTGARQFEEAPRVRREIAAEGSARQALQARSRGDRPEAIRLAASAAKDDPQWALLWAEMLFEGDRPFEARPAYELARDGFADGTEERILIEERLALIKDMEERERRR